MRRSSLLFLTLSSLLALTTAACRKAGRTNVHAYDSEDPVLVAAIAEARSTVSGFLDQLSHAKPDHRYLVKVRVEADGEVEHMWLEPVSYNGSALSGPIANEPHKITSVKAGSTVSAKPEEISDWVVLDAEGNLSAGGYTQKAMEAHKGKDPE